MAAPLSIQETTQEAPSPEAAPPSASDPLRQGHKPFWIALIILLGITAWIYWLCIENTHSDFVYPLDDTYIHLAMAKTLAWHGIWGVNAEDGFASAASSLAWPAQLAGLVLIFGAQDWLPLALNLLYGVLALAVAYCVLRSSGASGRLTFIVLLLAILFTSLPVLILLGMEHTMQAAVDLLFAAVAAGALASERPTWKQCLLAGILAALVTTTRYEGMFEIAAVAMLALLLRRWRELLAISFLGALPLALFGLYSVAQGSYWLPNPIAVKSSFYQIHSFNGLLQMLLGAKLDHFLAIPWVNVPVLLALLGLVADAAGRNRLTTRDRVFVLITVMTAGMHLFAANSGWLTRYEAYLVFMTLIAAAVACRPLLEIANFKLAVGDDQRAALVGVTLLLLFLVLFAPFLPRLRAGLFNVQHASKNIHDQQIQMARFVNKFYDGQPIVINDLGAIAFYTTARPVDMEGLATIETAMEYVKYRKGNPQHQYGPEFLDKLARAKGARIAIVYTSWFPYRTIPAGWNKAGSWKIKDNAICGDEVVDFYALDDEADELLMANLRAFAKSLPADVEQKGRFLTSQK